MIRVERAGAVRRITLARPEKRNALTPAMLERLRDAIAATDGAGAVLVMGEGRSFCAGFDLSLCVGAEGEKVLRSLLTGLSETVVAMRAQPAPVVLCAHGAAVAGGCALLGGADVVVSHEDAKLGYPVVKLGISPAVSAPFLAQAIGVGHARSRLLDPSLISGRRARELGLVNVCETDADTARKRAGEIAAKMARSAAACRVTKRWALTVAGRDLGAEALEASLSIAGSDEASSRLGAIWGRAADGGAVEKETRDDAR